MFIGPQSSEMLVNTVVALAILGVVMSDTYIINPGPGAFVPAAYNNPPYRPRENFTRPNSTAFNNTWNACMSPGYDLPKSHSSFDGCRHAGDKLLYAESIYKPGRFFSAREKFIDYPGEVPKGHVRDENITAIWCYDVRGYGKGGFCKVLQGGIGKKYARVHMYHIERNLPLSFKLEIYGRANNTAGNKLY